MLDFEIAFTMCSVFMPAKQTSQAIAIFSAEREFASPKMSRFKLLCTFSASFNFTLFLFFCCDILDGSTYSTIVSFRWRSLMHMYLVIAVAERNYSTWRFVKYLLIKTDLNCSLLLFCTLVEQK